MQTSAIGTDSFIVTLTLFVASSSEILDAQMPDDWGNGDDRLLAGGATCNCPPTCARSSYSATQTAADFPNRSSKTWRGIEELSKAR